MKKVLISGGTGSFGNAFARRIIAHNPERVVIYSRDEQKQEEMARRFPQRFFRFFLGDVRDQDRLEYAMHDIDTVIHAAALKIVPALEYNPTECVATNIGGAQNVVRAAINSGVKRVIALSTDKAVHPINLYGASKLAAEKIFIAANALAADATAFSVVRYGNVVGSRGSVVPYFKSLAAAGKPLTVTDTRMTRFWITLDQAVDLVRLAHTKMTGREIYIPKIPSVKIMDLALAISPAWEVTGIRPGEKLHECLLTRDEARDTLDMGDYYIITHPGWQGQIGSGIPVTPDFTYTSDTNHQWLSIEQLKESLNEA